MNEHSRQLKWLWASQGLISLGVVFAFATSQGYQVENAENFSDKMVIPRVEEVSSNQRLNILEKSMRSVENELDSLITQVRYHPIVDDDVTPKWRSIEEKLDAFSAQINKMTKQVQALEQDMRQTGYALNPSFDDSDGGDDSLLASEYYWEEQLSQLEEQHYTEEPDEVGASMVSDAFYSAINQEIDPSLAIDSIDCRTSGCWLEVSLSDPSGYKTLDNLLTGEMAPEFPQVIQHEHGEEGQGVRLTLYLQRQ